MKKLISLISAALLAAATVPAQANLMNGDFSDGWDGWIGTDLFDDFDPPDDANAAYGADVFLLCNGQISAGGGGTGAGNCTTGGAGEKYARIDPSPTAFGIAALIQQFTVPLGARTLSFDYLWAPSDLAVDGISFSIVDTAGNIFDLFEGLTNAQIVGGPNTRVVDISSFAGLDVTLAVGGFDVDFAADVIDVDNFQVRIPEPATLLLTGLGLAGIGAFRRKQRA